MSHVQNCTESITFQGFNAKAGDPGQLTHQVCSQANFLRIYATWASCGHGTPATRIIHVAHAAHATHGINIKMTVQGTMVRSEVCNSGCLLGCTKISKSFRNSYPTWYILYLYKSRRKMQKKWFLGHFPRLATIL